MGFCNIPVAGQLCDAADAINFATDPGGTIVAGIGNWIAKSCGELAAAAADLAADVVNKTTQVDLNATWFVNNYNLLLPIGLTLIVAAFCAQLIRAAIRRDGQALSHAFTATVSSILFAFSAIALTTVAVEVVDALSEGLFKAAGTSMEAAVRRMVKVGAIGALTPLGWLVPVIAALSVAVGGFLYWCVMMVRKVGILVMVTLAVFAAAGGGWEATRQWRRRWIEATAVLVVSKLLMTVVLVLGVSALGNTKVPATIDEGIAALSDVLAGVVIMFLVLLCPYMTFKFVSWASESADGETLHRAGGAGAQIVRQHAETAARKATSAAMSAGSGGAGAPAAGAAMDGADTVQGGLPGDIAPEGSTFPSLDKDRPTQSGQQSPPGQESTGSADQTAWLSSPDTTPAPPNGTPPPRPATRAAEGPAPQSPSPTGD